MWGILEVGLFLALKSFNCLLFSYILSICKQLRCYVLSWVPKLESQVWFTTTLKSQNVQSWSKMKNLSTDIHPFDSQMICLFDKLFGLQLLEQSIMKMQHNTVLEVQLWLKLLFSSLSLSPLIYSSCHLLFHAYKTKHNSTLNGFNTSRTFICDGCCSISIPSQCSFNIHKRNTNATAKLAKI